MTLTEKQDEIDHAFTILLFSTIMKQSVKSLQEINTKAAKTNSNNQSIENIYRTQLTKNLILTS